MNFKKEIRLPKPFSMYSVTPDGRVFSYYWGKRKLRKCHLSTCNYLRVRLTYDNKKQKMKTVSVHSLVAEAFLDKRPAWATQVNHIDGNKQNNHFTNLEWSTRKLNGKHASETGLYRVGINHPKTFFTEDEVRYIKYTSKLQGIGVVELSRRLNKWKGTIARIRNGDTWKHI